jgi:tetratricopeptide (TPR) repeat protein
MSLLLEALKKAEQAKQGETTQQPGAGASGAPLPAAGEGLSLAPDDTLGGGAPRPSATKAQPITRDRLPDITQNLEILPDDLAPGAGAPLARAAGSGRTRAPDRNAGGSARSPAVRASEGDAGQLDANREAARQLFDAHTVDYDPRRPFKLVLVGLGVAAIGVGIYFWWQLQPRSLSVAQAPPPPPPSQQIAAAPTPAPAPIPQAEPAPQPEPTPAPAAVEPPVAAAAVPTPPQPMPVIRPTGRPAQPVSRPQAAPQQAAAEPLPGARGTMSIRRSQSNVDAALKEGYAALEAGDLVTARAAYDRALRTDPRNRDGLLGLAAIDVRVGDYNRAAESYARVLELDPRDPDAAAGLIALRGTLDPVEAESRLKNLIAARPDTPVLHFALGNVFAAQSRWAEAQQSYFRAVAMETENPDYEFNLAVSLDQLHKENLALEHYQRALALAASRSAGFNKSQAEARIRDLQR